jgi:nitrous oxidase accessory protein NosD
VGGPHCYATVQAALAAAHDGDTIRVGRGTFAGGVTIAKSVNLFGVAAAAMTISGGGRL